MMQSSLQRMCANPLINKQMLATSQLIVPTQ